MIYTFYSFKGGVGRSMALASVAYLLATRGLRVLTVDFDLEAPGLERYFFESSGALAAKAKPGLIELLLAYKRALTNEAEFQKGDFRDWRRFVQNAVPTVQGGGSVDILTAGQREPSDRYGAYATEVRTFDWLDFFHHWKGERFFDWLRGELVGGADGGGAYDAVLVDSRTGITEMGGVCAYQLADVAVMLCAANEQNLEGTLRVAQDFRSDATLALRRGRRLDILVIPARLEAQNTRRRKFLDQFNKSFEHASYLPIQLAELGLSYERLALPYDPEFAIIEQIVGEQAADGGVASAAVKTFRQLADALTLLAWTPGKLRQGQESARRRILGLPEEGPEDRPQVADPTKAVADFDFFLDESALGSDFPSLAPGLREAGMRVATLGASISPGTDLAASVQAIIQASHALLVLFRSDEVSAWTSAVIDEARKRQRTIVPLVVASSPDAPAWRALRSASLAHLHAVQLDERQPRSWLPSVLGALKHLQTGPESGSAPATDAEPYPGTRPFTEADANFFFGRASELDSLLKLLEVADVGVLVGAAGIGKTSLVRAGLLPALRGSSRVAKGDTRRVKYLDISSEPDAPHGLATWLEHAAGERGLVVIDSVDSFPAGGDAATVDARIETIGRLLDALPQGVRALMVMRNALAADAHERALDRWRLRRGGRRTVRFELAALSAEAQAQVIEKPAARLGHVIDPGLSSLLISQAGTGPGAVAELARALPLLWQGRRRGWLTAATLEAQGGVQGLFSRAWALFAAGLAEPECRAAQGLIRSLSRLDNTMLWSAGSAPWSMLSTIPSIAAVDSVSLRDRMAAQHFIDLWAAPSDLAAAPDGAPALPPGEPTVALVHNLPPLFGPEHATPFDPGFLLWRNEFASYVLGWQRGGRNLASLLPKQALAEAELKIEEYQELLSEPERTLIEQSREQRRQADAAEVQRAADEQELRRARERADEQRLRLEEQARQQKRTQRLYMVITVMLIALLSVATFGVYWARAGEKAALVAQERAEAAEMLASASRQQADESAKAATTSARLLEELRQRADVQAGVAEERLQRVILQVADPAERRRLMAEHLPGATPVLTRTEQQQLDAKTGTQKPDNLARSPNAQPAGLKLWRNGATLRVRFLGGNSSQQAQVKAAIQEWSRYANLRFGLVDTGEAELRIGFDPSNGSWAYVGTDALGIPQVQASMNLGLSELGSVLHEFGHVLGLIHENQNPNAKLPWDREAVYREMTGPPSNWPRSTVDRSILDTVAIKDYRDFDADSIMMYAFAGKLFTDGVARGGKQVLSDSDKAFVRKLYPPN